MLRVWISSLALDLAVIEGDTCKHVLRESDLLAAALP